MRKKGKYSLTEAIYIVLSKVDEPLTYKEILRRIQLDKLAEVSGATPVVTVMARVGQEIKDNDEHSKFVRVKKGLVGLKERSH